MLRRSKSDKYDCFRIAMQASLFGEVATLQIRDFTSIPFSGLTDRFDIRPQLSNHPILWILSGP